MVHIIKDVLGCVTELLDERVYPEMSSDFCYDIFQIKVIYVTPTIFDEAHK